MIRDVAARAAQSPPARYGIVALLFVATVASAYFEATVGLVQSLLGVVLVVVVRLMFASRGDAFIILIALGALAAGALTRVLPFSLALTLSDAFIEMAILLAILIVVEPLVKMGWSFRWRGKHPKAAPGAQSALKTRTIRGFDERTAFVAFALLLAAAAVGASGPLGLGDGMLIWNYHYLSDPMIHASGHVVDPLLGVFVSIPDSLALSLVRYDGITLPRVLANSLVALSLFGFTTGFVLLAARLKIGHYGALVVAAVSLALPTGLPWRAAAPFDLWPALLVTALAMRGARPALIVLASVAATFLNIANAFEITILLCALRLSREDVASFVTWSASLAGIFAGILFGVALHAIAPAMAIREGYWSSDELGRIVGAEGIHISLVAGVIATILLAATLIANLGRKASPRLWRLTVITTASALVFGLPEHLGGVPLLSPAVILSHIMPQGWPSARVMQLILVALALPAAQLVQSGLEFAGRRSFSALPRVAAAAALLAILASAVSHPFVNPLLALPAGANAVEFPIPEGGSFAGLSESRDLLLSGHRILIPNAFVNQTPAFTPRDSLDSSETRIKLIAAGVHYVIVRDDFYAKPRLRTERDQLYRLLDERVPDLSESRTYLLEGIANNYKIFSVR